MRRNRNFDRPWFIHECSGCQQFKHAREFRRRSLELERKAVCKQCEGDQGDSTRISPQSNRL